MSSCICAGACLCAGAILGYVLHAYCKLTETNSKEVKATHHNTNDSIV